MVVPPDLKPRTIHPDKLTSYLLDLTHPEGAGKAKFFIRRGFDPVAPHVLEAALKDHPLSATLESSRGDAEAQRYVYQCFIRCPDGTAACIRSIWIEHRGDRHWRLVTAYPMV
jgi:hypothetical protein